MGGKIRSIGYARNARPNLCPLFLIFLLFWSDRHDRGFRALGRSPDDLIDHLAKKPLDHPDQHLVIGCEDKLDVIMQPGPDDVDRYLLFREW
jgi:hypothetical protein